MCGPSFDIHHHFAFKHQKEIIGVLMQVKREGALEFDHHDLVVIVVGHHLWVPVAVKERQFLG